MKEMHSIFAFGANFSSQTNITDAIGRSLISDNLHIAIAGEAMQALLESVGQLFLQFEHARAEICMFEESTFL
jgi:hypothetical protein